MFRKNLRRYSNDDRDANECDDNKPNYMKTAIIDFSLYFSKRTRIDTATRPAKSEELLEFADECLTSTRYHSVIDFF